MCMRTNCGFGRLNISGVETPELPKLLVRAGDLLMSEGNGSKDQMAGWRFGWLRLLRACIRIIS